MASNEKSATGDHRETETTVTLVETWICPVCSVNVPTLETSVEVTDGITKAWVEKNCPACGEVLKRQKIEQNDDGIWVKVSEVDHVF